MLEAIEITVPQKLDTMHLPAPELLSFYKDIERRIIWVDDSIDEGLIETVKWLLRWNQEDEGKHKDERKPIRMFIYSPGGDLYATFACVDVMLASETPIITINAGMAMSGGFLLLLAGEKRYALPHSTAMFHSGSAGFEGNAAQVETATKHYKKQLEQMKTYTLGRTTMNARTYNKYKDSDGWVDAQDQLKHGIVHEIVSNVSEIISGDQ